MSRSVLPVHTRDCRGAEQSSVRVFARWRHRETFYFSVVGTGEDRGSQSWVCREEERACPHLAFPLPGLRVSERGLRFPDGVNEHSLWFPLTSLP